jgi:hypothetical protein
MTDRRYSEEEVARIFKQAAEAQQTARRQLPSGEGMTITDLEAIGREVGIPSELVVQAARALDRSGAAEYPGYFGFRIRVGRTVDLDRRLTDDEWERLVVDLRETFDARGTVRTDGSLRQWTNGNLQALLEPTTTGHRLRLKTLNGNARNFMAAGLASVGVLGGVFVASILSVGSASIAEFIPMAIVGAGLFVLGAARLPRWAQTRARQMEGVAARLTLLIDANRAPPSQVGPGA